MKRITMTALALGTALAAVACGGASNARPVEIPPREAPPPPAPAPAPPAQSVTVNGPLNVQGGARRPAYTMEDLAALEKRRGFSELVEHLDDVPPAKRDAAWEALAEKGAIGLVSQYLVDRESLAAAGAADELGKRYPHLTSSAPFMQKRAEAGLDGFRTCYERSWSGAECTERFVGFVEADEGKTDLALKAGRLVITKQFPYVAVRFFKYAVASKTSRAAACADAELQRAVQAAEDGLPENDPIRQTAVQMKTTCKRP
jgi:hypothetical protein